MTKDEALKLALEALEEITLAGMSGSGQESEEAMTAWHARQAWKFIGIAARALDPIKQALAAQQEPVACLSETQAKAILNLALDLETTGRCVAITEGQERADFVARNQNIQYALEDALRNATTPPAQPAAWVGLDEDEVEDCARGCANHADLARAIEAKLREKNGGAA